jgi:hypothetical protein
VRFNHRNQVGPRRYRFNVGQKPVAPRPLLLARVFQFGKGRLHCFPRSALRSIDFLRVRLPAARAINQRFRLLLLACDAQTLFKSNAPSFFLL